MLCFIKFYHKELAMIVAIIISVWKISVGAENNLNFS